MLLVLSIAALLLHPVYSLRPSNIQIASVGVHLGEHANIDPSADPLHPATQGVPQRRVRVSGRSFVVSATDKPIVLAGPNVVVKGPPWLPAVSGDAVCKDDVFSPDCSSFGNCTTCTTFNQADVDHMKALGRNFIRLGVVWAGAQPRDENALDPDFVERLHAILNLTDRNGIHVMLDNHGDMVGIANCGSGIPMWVAEKAAPDLIGKPLQTDFPYSWFAPTVESIGGYAHCKDDAAKWAEHAGDPNYNMLNECCQHLNSGSNQGGLGYTSLSQKTMDYVMDSGRADFVRFWTLMAKEVAQHPSAFAVEPMNEPMYIWRGTMFDTWKEIAQSVNAIVPDMSVAVADIGEGALIPSWVSKTGAVDISSATVKFMKESNTLFYAWHWYGDPTIPEAIKNVQEIGEQWNMPTFATEFTSCDVWKAAEVAGISHSYWHYSVYCNTDAKQFGNKTFPTQTFGACILGWGGGNASKCA